MAILFANYFFTIFLILVFEILRFFCALDTSSEFDHSFEIDNQAGVSRESLKDKYIAQNRSCSLEKASICFYALVNNITKNPELDFSNFYRSEDTFTDYQSAHVMFKTRINNLNHQI
uniref:Uncharacterized protein n=1 Tax=Romanomermis culicivorax TaxID=13658 RepID=A0A915IGR4_ROMCU